MPSNSTQYSLDLPQLIAWMFRLAVDEQVYERFVANPMVFSSWYALVGEAVNWPLEAKEIQDSERSRKLSFEKAATLLGKVNYAMEGGSDVEHARRVLEGYALHTWVQVHQGEFLELLKLTLKGWNDNTPALERLISQEGGLPHRLDGIAAALQLSPTEKKVLYLAIACSSRNIYSLLEQLAKSRRTNVAQLWTVMLDCTTEDLRLALSSRGILRKSRLLQTNGDLFVVPVVSKFWIRLLSDTLESVFDSLLKPLTSKVGSGIPARIAEDDMELAVQVLTNAKEPGVNLLLYGADGLEKSVLLEEMLQKSGLQGYVLQPQESGWTDLPTIAFVAQRLLMAKNGKNAVLVVERPAEVLERKPSEFIRALFGIELDSSHIKPFDELILDTNPIPTIWAGPGADALPEECTARFVFHAPLKRAQRSERRKQLEQYVQGLKLSKATQTELLSLEEISSRQLETGLKAARLSGGATKKEREKALIQAVKRSLQALKRVSSVKEKECVTEYSLKYLNYSGKFGPEHLIKCLKLRPKASICLYGPPGTGKTQFVEHLAQQLGARLLVKRASDLMSKYVGENEQNIAKMFQEADNEGLVLFLDEGDSYLRDRSQAHAGWEVSQVNELLQQMERFPGIFIVATNLFQGLDAAVLRRFTFKMEFQPLSSEQRWEMFINESGMKGHLSDYPKAQRDKWYESLCFMYNLTAGDFATVKRQCILMGEALTVEQWMEQLKLECKIKFEGKNPSGTPSLV